MKVSATILAFCSAMLCIHAASFQVVKVNQTIQDLHVGAVDYNNVNQNNVKSPEKSNSICPSEAPTSPDAPLRERAICPWYFKETRVANRLPEVIQEAVCKCNGCLNGGTCVPTYADVPIMLKNQDDTIKFDTLRVAVACNCLIGQL